MTALTTTPTLRSQSSRQRWTGFTLIELLVSIAILALIIFLVNKVFSDTQRLVTGGAATSQIISQSRTISQQLLDDAKNMLSFESANARGNAPGFLLIVQREYDPAKASTLGMGIAYRDGDALQPFRSDQIAFIRDASEISPITAGEANRYDSRARASYARIWIGHVGPQPPGSDLTLDPGDAGYNFAPQLMLGRQALLLIEKNKASLFPNGTDGDLAYGSSIVANLPSFGFASPGNPSANTAAVPVANAAAATGIATPRLHHGLTDAIELPGLYDDPNNTSPLPSLVDTGTTLPRQGLLDSDLAANGLPTDSYARRALNWSYAIDDRRLQFVQQVGTPFLAVDVNRTHTVLTPHVSDFIIEFAADFIDDYNATNDKYRGETSFTTDSLPDGQPDTVTVSEAMQINNDAGRIVVSPGQIKWYTSSSLANFPTNIPPGMSYDPDKPLTWPIPSERTLPAGFENAINDFGLGAITGNPFEYDQVSLNTTFGLPGVDLDHALVWSHSGDDNVTTPLPGGPVEGCGKYWPYLLRFRYRLHDGRGEYNSDGGLTPGRWFEQIVAVPRRSGLE